ncbi:MAG: methylated-DNA--[protein]-cysteine S-methyltransferase [Actinobacteria bacterium]|nr:methylated-DNA--[protein]-cysteine S-methyltransferase [Actinomycetota bacterium]
MTVTIELDRRFREAATAEGTLDVGFDVVDSPFGPLLVAATPRGLCRVWLKPDPEQQLDSLAGAFGRRVLRSHTAVEGAHRQLDEYFAGAREGFELDVDLGGTAAFARAVLDELARVPYGRTTTYGTLAARVGAPRAARAVGTVMNRNPIPIVLPCHRVVGANGSLTGYAGGLAMKEQLLRLEGALL